MQDGQRGQVPGDELPASGEMAGLERPQLSQRRHRKASESPASCVLADLGELDRCVGADVDGQG